MNCLKSYVEKAQLHFYGSFAKCKVSIKSWESLKEVQIDRYFIKVIDKYFLQVSEKEMEELSHRLKRTEKP